MMTGIYAVSMNIFGALGSGSSVPISSFRGFGWQGALGIEAVVSCLAFFVWIPQLCKQKQTKQVGDKTPAKNRVSAHIFLFLLIFYSLESQQLKSHYFISDRFIA